MTFLQHAWLKYQVHRLMNGAIGEGETLARGVATCSISNRIEASSSKWRIAAESNSNIDMHLYISGHPGCYPMKKMSNFTQFDG